MRFELNNDYDFDEFDKILFEVDTFENCIPIGNNVDNANRQPMNKQHFQDLQNAL